MRLWHKDLIQGLPREQLVSQWRECSAIAKSIKTKGTPNHILVNKVMDYPIDHFISYSYYVRQEMTKRGYKTMQYVMDGIIELKPDYKLLPIDQLFINWHTNIYMKVCYWNLYEKYDCGGIEEKAWEEILKYAK